MELLHPCYQATKDLSGDEYSTGSMIIPVTKMLMTTYANAERQALAGSFKKQLSSTILKNLQDRFDPVEKVRILGQATLLDPRFKNKCF